jgi:hypothetical protein
MSRLLPADPKGPVGSTMDGNLEVFCGIGEGGGLVVLGGCCPPGLEGSIICGSFDTRFAGVGVVGSSIGEDNEDCDNDDGSGDELIPDNAGSVLVSPSSTVDSSFFSEVGVEDDSSGGGEVVASIAVSSSTFTSAPADMIS